MKDWENFEKEIFEYLKEILEKYDTIVKHYGKADSTIPDIEITINKTKEKFYIDIKMPASQTSQFVVEIKNNKFVYGSRNQFKTNKFSEEIIDVLNQNFDFFKNVSQTGLIVPIPDEIVFSWVIYNMECKNVKFITSIDNKGNKKVFSLKDISSFFNIKTILRRKKSGSQSLPKKYYDDFKSAFRIIGKNINYEFIEKDNKLFVKTNVKFNNSQKYINSNILPEGKKYYLSNKKNDIYEVRLTSATNNPNIIFELSLKDNTNFDLFTLQNLIDYINRE